MIGNPLKSSSFVDATRRWLRPLLLTVLLLAGLAWPAAAKLTIIVNPANTISKITTEQLGAIFLGRLKSFPGGSGKPVPYDQSESTKVYEEFAKTVLGKSPNELKAYWAKQIFSGKGNPPRRVNNDEEAIREVAGNPQGIAYLSEPPKSDNVKTIELVTEE